MRSTSDLVFSELDEFDSLYIPKSNPPNMNQPTVLDYWYFSSSKNMDIVSDFHSHWKEYGFRSAHHDLYQWPTDNDIDIIMLSKFEESEKGSLEVGKLADIAVLSDNILDISDDRLSTVKVEMTILGGRIVYSRG